ncbi:MAG: S-layer homology domain-containing protein, partial [Clostridia bacterium]|nr:S-layer homology domain-containing protein [Clostridia bacterium]
LVYPEFKVVREPLSDVPANASLPGSYMGGWKAVGDYRTLYTARKFLFPDGSSTEVSFSYTKYILNLYTRIFSTTAKLGLDASATISQAVLDCFEKYLLFLTNMSNPRTNGGGWQQGDAASHQTAAISNYGEMIKAINNPVLDWLYSGKTQGEEPDYLSYVYDDAGKAVLRSGWDTQALAIQINADAGKNSHGHSDDMTINLHAYGKMLLADPMQPNYDATQPVTAWMYSTRAHNTIEINDTSQEGSGRNTTNDLTYTNPAGEEETVYGAGECEIGSLHPENREFNKMYNFIRAESFGYKDHDKLTDRFKTYRDILFIEPEYFIVTDYLDPLNFKSVSNKYAQHWHTLPDANISLDEESGSVRTNFESGANIIIAPINGSITLESSIKKGWYSDANTVVDYVKYVKNASGTVTFNTVLYPLKAQEDKSVVTENLALDVAEGEASAAKITVTDEKTGNVKNAHYYNLHDLSKKAERVFGNYKTDAELAFVQTAQDDYEKLIIRNGKNVSLAENGDAIVISQSNISDLGIVWNVDRISLTTSKNDITYTDIKIYAPNTTKVFLNDEEITFARDGNYIIPTSSGVIAPAPETPTEGEGTPSVPEHGSGGTDTGTSGGDTGSDDSGSSGGSGGGGAGGGNKVDYPSIPTTDVSTGTPQLPQTQNLFKGELSGHWAESEITKMVDAQMINGDEKGNLNLKNAVTRAEFITLLVRALKLGEKTYQGGFSDVTGGEWYASYLAAAKENGLLDGDGGRAMPNDVITREQMAKMLVSACEIQGKTADAEDVTYTDFAAVSDWAKEFVKKASALGILNGFEDGSFAPKGNVLREQAFVAVYRLVY